MITAETVNGIVRFQASGLPVVSLYCRVDPGASQREVRARVDSLLDQIRPLAKDRDLDHRYRLSARTDIERIKDTLDSERWPPGTIAIFSCSGRGLYEEIPLPRRVREQVMVDKTPLVRPMLAVLGEYPRACVLVVNREAAPVWEMYQDEMREVQTVADPLRKADDTGGSRPEDRIQNRLDEQAKRHFRRAASMIDQLLRSDGYDILVVGGHEYELVEFFRLLPQELRGRVAGTFSADPIATPVAEIRGSAEGVMRRYQHEQDQRLVAHVLELAAAGGLAAVGPEDCLWAGSMSAIDTLLVRDGATLVGWSVTSPAGWRPPGTSARSAGSPPDTPRTSWTSSRRPSSRPAARPGRSRRTSCQTSTRPRRSFGSRLHRERQGRGRQGTASHEYRRAGRRS
jgi:peptide subunit release factor 1 (eRF1)